MTILDMLGIHEYEIEKAAKMCQEALDIAYEVFEDWGVEDCHTIIRTSDNLEELVLEYLEYDIKVSDLTNSIIGAYMHITTTFLNNIIEKSDVIKNADIKYVAYVNGADTHLYIETNHMCRNYTEPGDILKEWKIDELAEPLYELFEKYLDGTGKTYSEQYIREDLKNECGYDVFDAMRSLDSGELSDAMKETADEFAEERR